MVVGLDTLGNAYLSVYQCNSNAAMMRIFFLDLIKVLDRQRPDWRNNTVLLLDGAKYHKEATVLQLMEELRVPVCFLGPYSYLTAIAEAYFAWYKQVDLNPRHLPTGKQ